jgi:TatD DNase family protein
VGCHPTHCDKFEPNSERYLNELLQLAQEGMKKGHVVAIGECGLDYDRIQFCNKLTQKR